MGKRFRRFLLFSFVISGAVMFSTDAGAENRTRVVAGIPPIAWAVDQLGGDRVDVQVLLPLGASPETFSPTPQALTGLSDARVLLIVGVPFEERITERVRDFAGQIEIVDVSNGIDPRHFENEVDGSDHDHGLADPHVWLDPINMCTVVANIANSLSGIDPDNASSYKTRADSVVGRLRELDEKLSSLMKPVEGRTVLVYHPSFGYFTDRYGLRQVAIERHGKEASARQLGELIAQARHDEIGVLFTQPQFPRRQAEVIAGDIGATVSVVDPLSRDYIAMMYDLGRQFRRSFGETVVSQ